MLLDAEASAETSSGQVRNNEMKCPAVCASFTLAPDTCRVKNVSYNIVLLAT
jgi:hypothetical protein